MKKLIISLLLLALFATPVGIMVACDNDTPPDGPGCCPPPPPQSIYTHLVRTDEFGSVDEYFTQTRTIVITSVTELNEYLDRFELGQSTAYVTRLRDYDQDFFAERYLVIVSMFGTSTSDQFEFSEIVQDKDGNATVVIDRSIGEIRTNNAARWSMLLEIPHDQMPEFDELETKIVDIRRPNSGAVDGNFTVSQFSNVPWLDIDYTCIDPRVTRITNAEELNAYLLNYTYRRPQPVAYLQALSRFDDDFFTDNYLVLVGVFMPYDAMTLGVRTVTADGTILLARTMPPGDGAVATVTGTRNLVFQFPNTFSPQNFTAQIEGEFTPPTPQPPNPPFKWSITRTNNFEENFSNTPQIHTYVRGFELALTVSLFAPSGSIQFELSDIQGSTIHINRIIPQRGTADIAQWRMSISLPLEFQEVQGWNVTLHDIHTHENFTTRQFNLGAQPQHPNRPQAPVRITSVAQLAEYLAYYKALSPTHMPPLFAQTLSRFDATFFANNYLVVAYHLIASPAIQLRVGEVTNQGEIRVLQHMAGQGAPMFQDLRTVLEFPNTFQPETFTVSYVSAR